MIGYDIDFPEEDDGPVAPERVVAQARVAMHALEELLQTAPVGELLRDGAVAVIAGPPNAGKSSLFNALLGKARAIVTEIPGTTRDALEALIDVDGWPVRLVDTAGIRPTEDAVEQLGVAVSERYLAAAHLVILCSESEPPGFEISDRIEELSRAPVIRVRTKFDLVTDGSKIPASVIPVSAVTRAGLPDLLAQVTAVLRSRYGAPIADIPVITRTRHRLALQRALSELQLFDREWAAQTLPAPVAAVHLRAAILALEELVGAVDVDDVLDKLFSSFCVGK